MLTELLYVWWDAGWARSALGGERMGFIYGCASARRAQRKITPRSELLEPFRPYRSLKRDQKGPVRRDFGRLEDSQSRGQGLVNGVVRSWKRWENGMAMLVDGEAAILIDVDVPRHCRKNSLRRQSKKMGDTGRRLIALLAPRHYLYVLSGTHHQSRASLLAHSWPPETEVRHMPPPHVSSARLLLEPDQLRCSYGLNPTRQGRAVILQKAQTWQTEQGYGARSHVLSLSPCYP